MGFNAGVQLSWAVDFKEKEVIIHLQGETLNGKVLGVNKQGELQLQQAEGICPSSSPVGKVVNCHSGEASLQSTGVNWEITRG